jgi:hypothetical protein
VNGSFFGLAIIAALNPKLLGVDLLLIENRRPQMMFLLFLIGGAGLSLSLGLLDVLLLHADEIKAQGQASATLDLAVGIPLILIGAVIVGNRLPTWRPGRWQRPGSAERKKRESRAQRALRNPRPGVVVLVGALMGTPGAAYITEMHHLIKGTLPTGTQIAAVVVFVAIQFALVIVPLVFLLIWPERTKSALRTATVWLTGHVRLLIGGVALGIGTYMAVSGFLRLS